MKKFFAFFFAFFGIFVTYASADALKNSLNNMLKAEETSSVVNIGQVDFNAKAKPVPRIRKSTSTLLIVNGRKVFKKDADEYLTQRTQGKMTDFNNVPAPQQERLLRELSVPILMLNAAEKELSEKEKNTIFQRAWMQKEAMRIKVSDEDAMGVYGQLKKRSEENNNTAAIPEFDKIKNKLKAQILEKMIVDGLMKDVDIKIF
ncbi:MAG: hypothetical protein DRQ78_01630 [Epsilonproteobacteria bacterium]|nr:MAG: hypothetical protein DRQ78_01630 [Campylobacterota bacterium]